MLIYPSETLSTPLVHITFPPPSLLEIFPPLAIPTALAPPAADFTIARPFNIDPTLYNDALDFRVPLAIATTYALTVTLVNRINKQRAFKPYAFSKSIPFYAFVVLHNVALAVYSAWTCMGMINAARHVWPGWKGPDGVTGVVDAFCKIQGPRGLGNAVTYNSSTSSWGVTNKAILLLDNNPDHTDVGRMWNEGLAYYGWLFYISKFYEVIDTAVVLAKGKRSSTLQTYHHAGAMISMWAGMRYMSPPIWMFVLVNSGIHTFMYTYYTFTSLSIAVSPRVKKLITTLQIAQLVWGSSYALAHLFFAYSIPVSVPYLFTHNLSTALSGMTSTVSSVIESATATAGLLNVAKKFILRAAGHEGLAENVLNEDGEPFGIDAIKIHEVEKANQELRYRLEYPSISCLDTSGQAFAILLNVAYLTPLTFLFVRFFVKSYTRRSKAATGKLNQSHLIGHAGNDALKGLEREIKDGYSGEGVTDDAEIPAEVKELIDHVKDDLQTEYDKVIDAGAKVVNASKKKGKHAKSKLNKVIDEANEKHEKDGKTENDGDGEWNTESTTESTTTDSDSRTTITRTESSSRTERSSFSTKQESKSESDPSDSTVLVDSHTEDTTAYEANIDDIKSEEEIQEEDKTT